ncbi:ATP-grasp domain-containing protein [Robiginitomaculum antarcticum]|uniref:hypothetical protein n=1 Tax=Robiginitomaculum antarcticum TaxID=437507 RepID=UPI00036FC421|nr:hypothetical protein [Robiginitomaculum antarcticum]
MRPWWTDFQIDRGCVYVRATDTYVPISRSNTRSVLRWFLFYVCEKARALPQTVKRPAFYIYCRPAPPRAWYVFWAAARRANIDIYARPDEADCVFYFEDATRESAAPEFEDILPGINADCTDISKSKVAAVFESVFGYSLTVTPSLHTGPMVCKSEKNGAHDGGIVTGPVASSPGRVYQRLIDNMQGQEVVDLRCATIGGDIALIFVKRRPVSNRFANDNASCQIADPKDWLSQTEREQLSEFCAKMKLDFGGIDVLRDRADGRIYVVDVNKTDMGPPAILPLKEKLRSTDILAKALKRHIKTLIEKKSRTGEAK